MLRLGVETVESDGETILMRAGDDLARRRIALATVRAEMNHPGFGLAAVSLGHEGWRIDLDQQEFASALPVPSHGGDVERRRSRLHGAVVKRDGLAVRLSLDGNADRELQSDIGALRRRSRDGCVLRRIGLAARRVAAARVLEVEQGEVGVLPVVLRKSDRRARAFGVDQLDAINIKSRIVQFGLDMSAAQIGHGRAAADLPAVGGQPKGDRDRAILGGRSLHTRSAMEAINNPTMFCVLFGGIVISRSFGRCVARRAAGAPGM